jgi:hypothetical protein
MFLPRLGQPRQICSRSAAQRRDQTVKTDSDKKRKNVPRGRPAGIRKKRLSLRGY